jgi:anti-anti-sigma factor
VDANSELVGLGAANLAAGLSSGMVVNGSLSKTAVNGGAGARSQVSSLVVAAMTVVTLLFLTGLFENLPEATLSAVVIAAVWELIDVRSLARLYRLSTQPLARGSGLVARPDFLAAVAALLGVLVFDTLPGLFIGIGVSLALLLYRASRPHIATLGRVPGTEDQYGDIERHPENETAEGVTVLRVESGLFFANADHVRDTIRASAAASGVRAVVLDMETVPGADVSAVRMLAEVREELERTGVRLVLARDIGGIRDIMRRELGPDALRDVHPTVRAALDALQSPTDETGAPSEPVG